MKKIFIIVSHSSGELDTLFPLIFELKRKYLIKVKILVPVKKIYDQIIINDFYLKTAKKLKIKIFFSQSYNKFDYPLNNKKLNLLIKLFIQIRYTINNIDVLLYDHYFHETTNQKSSTFIFKLATFFLKKNIFVYHHGQSLNQIAFKKKFNYYNKNIFLTFTKLNVNWVKNIGFNNVKIVGFCKFYPNWNMYIKDYSKKSVLNKKYVLIYSRPSEHPYYMNNNKYKYLLTTSYKTIRNLLPDYEILVKLHPREDDKKFIKFLEDNYLKQKISITKENSSIIASKAKFTISFWSSAILDSLSLGIPSIEYYIEDELFKKAEPRGSLYRINGIISVNNVDQLKENILKIINNEYIEPKIVDFFKSEMDINFLD